MMEEVRYAAGQARVLLWVLFGAFAGWVLLALVARAIRMDVIRFEVADLDQAMMWAKSLLGLAAVLGGFLGVSKSVEAVRDTSVETSSAGAEGGSSAGIASARAEGGTLGILGGATLLEVGGTAVPVALAVFVAAGGGVRLIRSLRGDP